MDTVKLVSNHYVNNCGYGGVNILNASNTKRKARTVLDGGSLAHLISDVKIAFKAIKVKHPLFHAVKLIEKDDLKRIANVISIFDEQIDSIRDASNNKQKRKKYVRELEVK